jgi:hypothetical protein
MKDFKLNKNDYLSILHFYNIHTQNLKSSDIKKTAENILVTKLCRCIKSVNNYKTKNKTKKKTKKTDSIGICKNSVFTKKQLRIYKFNCKKDKQLLSKNKTTKQNIFKIEKHI